MSYYATQMQSTEGGEVQQHVRFAGGTNAVSKLFGRGIQVNRIGPGLVDLVWLDPQGVYLGIAGFTFDATTPSEVAGYSVVAGDYNLTTRTLRLNINKNDNTLVDLTATQRLTIRPTFKTFNG